MFQLKQFDLNETMCPIARTAAGGKSFIVTPGGGSGEKIAPAGKNRY
jgi:hypothetical protein